MQAVIRTQLTTTLRGMFDGKVSLVEGCRIVTKLLRDGDASLVRSEAAATIAGVESETDSFPVGSERQHWNQAALLRMDAELAEYLERVREPLLEACQSLLELVGAQPLNLDE